MADNRFIRTTELDFLRGFSQSSESGKSGSQLRGWIQFKRLINPAGVRRKEIEGSFEGSRFGEGKLKEHFHAFKVGLIIIYETHDSPE